MGDERSREGATSDSPSDCALQTVEYHVAYLPACTAWITGKGAVSSECD